MDEVRTVCAVEVGGTFASKFEMLLLVGADWDMRCPGGRHQLKTSDREEHGSGRLSVPVNKDVGCLQDRIGEQPKLEA